MYRVNEVRAPNGSFRVISVRETLNAGEIRI